MTPKDRLNPETFRHDHGGYINPMLVERQGVDDAGIDLIRRRHAEMDAVKRMFKDADRPEVIAALVADVARIEYLMQDAWRFPRSASHHTHWRLVPGCTCPEAQNELLRGSPYRVIADDCPIHSTANARDGHVTVDHEGHGKLAAAPRAIAPMR